MRKHFTLLLVIFLFVTQALDAQLDMVFFSNFSAASNKSVNHLTWTIERNQIISTFDIERSTNGQDFKTVAVLAATTKLNAETYTFSDTVRSPDKIMYRLKVMSKSQYSLYSKIIIVKPEVVLDYNIKIIGNPVRDQLAFMYNSSNAQQADIRIYNLSGKVVFNRKQVSSTGLNIISIPLTSGLLPGIYSIEINNGTVTQRVKFVKQ